METENTEAKRKIPKRSKAKRKIRKLNKAYRKVPKRKENTRAKRSEKQQKIDAKFSL